MHQDANTNYGRKRFWESQSLTVGQMVAHCNPTNLILGGKTP
jgi:hypothetical protein